MKKPFVIVISNMKREISGEKELFFPASGQEAVLTLKLKKK